MDKPRSYVVTDSLGMGALASSGVMTRLAASVPPLPWYLYLLAAAYLVIDYLYLDHDGWLVLGFLICAAPLARLFALWSVTFPINLVLFFFLLAANLATQGLNDWMIGNGWSTDWFAPILHVTSLPSDIPSFHESWGMELWLLQLAFLWIVIPVCILASVGLILWELFKFAFLVALGLGAVAAVVWLIVFTVQSLRRRELKKAAIGGVVCVLLFGPFAGSFGLQAYWDSYDARYIDQAKQISAEGGDNRSERMVQLAKESGTAHALYLAAYALDEKGDYDALTDLMVWARENAFVGELYLPGAVVVARMPGNVDYLVRNLNKLVVDMGLDVPKTDKDTGFTLEPALEDIGFYRVVKTIARKKAVEGFDRFVADSVLAFLRTGHALELTPDFYADIAKPN